LDQNHHIAHVGVSLRLSQNLKVISCEIIFEVFQPVYKTHVYVTDKQTDDIPWHNRALRSIAR